MKVTINFRASVTIEGKNRKEIEKKFMELPLFSEEALKCNAEFVEDMECYDEDYCEVSLDI